MAGHFLVSRLNVFIAGIIPFVLVPNSCSSLDTSSPSPVFSLDVFAKQCHTLSFPFSLGQRRQVLLQSFLTLGTHLIKYSS